MKENHHTHTHTLTIHTHNTDTHIKENHQRDGLRFCLKWLKRIDEGNKVCVLLSCVLLCSAQPTHLNIVACDPRHAHSVVPGPLNGLNSVVPGPCMSGHTVLAQRERERSREREKQVGSQCLAASNAYMPPLGTCPGGLLFSFCRELARSCLRQAHGVYVLRALLLLKPGLARVPSQVHAFNKQVLGLPCPTSRRGGKPVHNADLTARI